MQGTLIPVVGPSGAGKDTMIDAARIARPDIYYPTRVITRPESAGGEVFRGVETAQFRDLVNQRYFAFHWSAHALFYGIPYDIIARLNAGHDVMFNGSRGIIEEARLRFKNVRVMVVTAPQDVLAKRLAARGREEVQDIANRLKRAAYTAPEGADVTVIQNDGSLKESLADFLAALPQGHSAHSV